MSKQNFVSICIGGIGTNVYLPQLIGITKSDAEKYVKYMKYQVCEDCINNPAKYLNGV